MSEFIPQFSLARQSVSLAPSLERAVQRVLSSGRYALGPECEALEVECAAALAVPSGAGFSLSALSCSSGTDALHLALRAVGVGAGDVVLTTPFTFFATASAAVLCGARPEFVDIQPWDFNLDPALLAAALCRPREGRVAAIVPVHLYGAVAPMPAILAAAGAAGVPVVEDAAQSFGAWAPATEAPQASPCPAGGFGAAGCISFYPTKNLGALGEAGMVLTRDAVLLDRLRLLRVHGSRRRYEHEEWGWNARLDELQAALLRAKLPFVEGWNRRRRAIAELYEQCLLAAGVAAVASPAAASLEAAGAALLLPARTPGHVFHQYVVRVGGRDELRRFLAERGIGAEVYYPIPLHHQPVLRATAGNERFPHAERAAAEVLALPMFPELRDDEVARVAAAIGEYFHGGVARKRATVTAQAV